MAKFQTVGIENAIAELAQQGEKWQGAAGKAVYEGAKIVTDEVRRQISKIPYRRKKQGDLEKGLRPWEIKGLQESLGIAKASKSGDEVNVLIGFDGYNDYGKPNSMIARSINGGTYFLQKYPFLTYALNATKGQAESAMASAFEEALGENNNG